MQLFKVGPNNLLNGDLELLESFSNFSWMVYWYQAGDWGHGDGQSLAINKSDGLLYFSTIGHCSCFGPIDDWPKCNQKFTVEEFFSNAESALDPISKEVREKATELLQQAEAANETLDSRAK